MTPEKKDLVMITAKKRHISWTTTINMFSSLLLLMVSVHCGWLGGTLVVATDNKAETPPVPKPWPLQFHSILMVNYSGNLSQIDLWYDWPNGRNFNIIQDQLASEPLYDLEWNNGTSFFYKLESDYCRSAQLEVGILRPNWLQGANYLGQQHVDGFLCNVWEKVDFIWYYEDVITNQPVHWVFYTGRTIHVMTFEVGAVLEDEKWQAPSYCFGKKEGNTSKSRSSLSIGTYEHHMNGLRRDLRLASV